MKNADLSIEEIHKAFESRIRLGIMSALAVNESLDFTSLKEYLNVSDGNLASHLKMLEKEKFIGIEKSFVERKPNTNYHMTKEGKKAFDRHLAILKKILTSQGIT